jgi:hypothetical protein
VKQQVANKDSAQKSKTMYMRIQFEKVNGHVILSTVKDL